MGAVSGPGLSTYIPKPDEFTRRNKVLQAGAALGLLIGGGLLLKSALRYGFSSTLSGKTLVVSTLVSAAALWALRKIDSPYFWIKVDDTQWRATPLQYADYQRRTWLVKLLFALGANPNAKDSSGDSLLHWQTGFSTMRQAIENGADVNARDNLGRTPLHIHHEEIRRVRLLIQHGANPYLQQTCGTDTGKSPLDLACKRKQDHQAENHHEAVVRQDEIIQILQSSKANASA